MVGLLVGHHVGSLGRIRAENRAASSLKRRDLVKDAAVQSLAKLHWDYSDTEGLGKALGEATSKVLTADVDEDEAEAENGSGTAENGQEADQQHDGR